jgi:spermidine synthase
VKRELLPKIKENLTLNSLGRHILVEFNSCNPEKLNDVAFIEQSMVRAAEVAGATVINSTFHHFSPWGVSGVVVIQESHLAIHTWPEYRYAAVDLFTCGETVNPWVSFNHLKNAFEANFSALEMNRGSLEVIKKTNFKTVDHRSSPLPENQGAPGARRIERNVWFTDKDDNQALSLRYTGDVLFDETTPYQRVRVLESYAYGKMLTINNMVMCTERDEAHYHEMIVHPLMQVQLQQGTAQNVLVIGGGDGGTVRELLKYDSVQSIHMIEIDQAVVAASKKFLPTVSRGLSHPKVRLEIGDGIEFIKKASSAFYDIIIVDGSDPVGPAEGLFSNDFYLNCFKALKPKGALITQGESPMFHQKTFVELNQCLKGIFGREQTHTLLFHATTYPSGMWSLQMAFKGVQHPTKSIDYQQLESFCQTQELRYYNADLHRASFALPSFVRRLIST